MSPTILFQLTFTYIIYESYYTISINFHLYLQYF